MGLRSIDAEGAGIQVLDNMQPIPSLLILNLMDNEIEDLHALSMISTCCEHLQHLDLRENPVAAEMSYRLCVSRELPRLLEHDNQSRRKYVAKPRDYHCRLDFARAKDVHAVDGLIKNDRCSC